MQRTVERFRGLNKPNKIAGSRLCAIVLQAPSAFTINVEGAFLITSSSLSIISFSFSAHLRSSLLNSLLLSSSSKLFLNSIAIAFLFSINLIKYLLNYKNVLFIFLLLPLASEHLPGTCCDERTQVK